MAGNVFQKLKSSVDRSVTTISIKTSSSLEKAKLRTHMDSLRNEINLLLAESGAEAYEIWKNGENDFFALNERFESIREKEAEIERLEQECAVIDERDAGILGTLRSFDDSAVSAEYICPECGAAYTSFVKFCRKCGTPMQQE